MIPHGNCRDATQSRRVVDKHKPATPRNNNIVGEFVLYDYFRNNGRSECPTGLRKCPRHYILEIFLRRQFFRDAGNCIR